MRKQCRYCEKDCTPSSHKRHEKSCMKKCLGGPVLPMPDRPVVHVEKFDTSAEEVFEEQMEPPKPPILVIRCRKPIPMPEPINTNVGKKVLENDVMNGYWELPNTNNQSHSGWVGGV